LLTEDQKKEATKSTIIPKRLIKIVKRSPNISRSPVERTVSPNELSDCDISHSHSSGQGINQPTNCAPIKFENKQTLPLKSINFVYKINEDKNSQ
jgi:hypothetical protein